LYNPGTTFFKGIFFLSIQPISSNNNIRHPQKQKTRDPQDKRKAGLYVHGTITLDQWLIKAQTHGFFRIILDTGTFGTPLVIQPQILRSLKSYGVEVRNNNPPYTAKSSLWKKLAPEKEATRGQVWMISQLLIRS
jgi:hypothetical protein